MTQTPAGWYRDPSGLPDAYRWWDGSQWTTGLTTNQDAPPPTDAAPVRPPAPPAQEEQQTQQQPPANRPPIPPPPGAPGPGYVPPPPWAVQQRGPLTDVVEVAPSATSNKRKALIAAIAVVCVALLGVGGYFILTNSGERTPAAAPSPPPAGEEQSPDADPPPQGEPDPSDQPTVEPPGEGQPSPDPTEQAPDQPRLTYTPPGGKWFDSPLASEALPFGTAQNLVTEDNYRGEQDWVALISAGYSQPGWYDDDDLAGTAKRAAAWFADTNFGEFPVNRKQLSAKPVKVDGHDAYELKERFSYTIENLKAKSEDVTIVVVDLGLTEAGGVFLASLPDTHPGEAATITKARNSLEVEE